MSFYGSIFHEIDQNKFICYDAILSEFKELQPQGQAFETRGPGWKQLRLPDWKGENHYGNQVFLDK